MKKIIFCLAATALMTIGCSGKANAYKVSEKKFEEEITNYGFVLNNNAKFEGSVVMTVGTEAMTQSLEMEMDSEGEHKRFKIHQEVEGEGEMNSVVELKETGETFELNWYRKSFVDTSYSLIKQEGLTREELLGNLNEIVYLPGFKYNEVKFNKDNNSYHCDSYTVAIHDGGSVLAAIYTNVNLQFKDNRLDKVDFFLSAPGGNGTVQFAKTQTGGIAVELPNIE